MVWLEKSLVGTQSTKVLHSLSFLSHQFGALLFSFVLLVLHMAQRCCLQDQVYSKKIFMRCGRIHLFFRWPRDVAYMIKCIQGKNFRGVGEERNKLAWISWDKVCCPSQAGDLDIKDLQAFNKALLGNWRRRMMKEKDSLWCRVLTAKYGDINGRGSTWWRGLGSVCGIEDGPRVKFGEDKRRGGESLTIRHNRLYGNL
ncbi:putative ribonuclease H protein, partial [Mucuna pruriens]